MVAYLVRRLLHSVLLVLIVLTLTFLLSRLAPGDPLNVYYSPDVDPELIPRMRHQFGLDGPLLEQYVRWIWNFSRGDFGVSLTENRPVREIIVETVPRTLQLTVLALAMEILLGLAAGIFMAGRRKGILERGSMLSLLLFYSIPTFYLAYAMIFLFSLKLGLLPSANMFSLHAAEAGMLAAAGDRFRHLVLPVSVLSLGGAAGLARFTRGSMADVLQADFIRAARAKGVPEARILWRHGLRNALPSILTVLGLSFPFLLGGSVVVEKIFSWPGMGALAVDAIFARDYPVILATTFVGTVMVVFGNFLADLSYWFADPRIKIA